MNDPNQFKYVLIEFLALSQRPREMVTVLFLDQNGSECLLIDIWTNLSRLGYLYLVIGFS